MTDLSAVCKFWFSPIETIDLMPNNLIVESFSYKEEVQGFESLLGNDDQ